MGHRTRNLVVVSFLLAAVAAYPRPALGQCDVERQVDGELDAAAISGVLVQAGAGALQVTGGDDSVIRVRGIICASDEDMAAEARLILEERRGAAWIETDLPDGGGWNGRYARMDLTIEMPRSLSADIRDGSGEMVVRSIAAVHVDDGSGEVRIEDIAGAVQIEDGSGEIRVNGAGSVEVDDGSGTMEIADVRGDVRILEDGSGGIEVRDVEGGVTIEEDGSGSIDVVRVGGDFVLEDDGSGSVTYADVQGRVILPREG
jgi:hypothetical protein